MSDGGPTDVERERVRREARRALLGVPSAPLRIGRFEIRGHLGGGASGIVYDAYDTELHRSVALKVLKAELASEPEHVLRMRREGQALARLDHPNVVRVYEVAEHEGNLYLVMERLEGQPLSLWLSRTDDAHRIATCLLGAAQGLAAAHALGLLHRDFKPTNVVVGASDHATVIDFGLVRAYKDAPASTPLDQSVTRTGATLGTPLYMAPEQLLGKQAEASSDQFAFCTVLYEALFHTHPFEGNDPRALAASIAAGALRAPSRPTPLGQALWPLIARGLQPAPAARHASMAALALAIERALSEPVVGARIADRYLLREKIGAGGMGVVFRAFDERTQREVAIKVLADAHAADPKAQERLRREAHATASLRHPSIAMVLDAGVTREGTSYFAMELISGRSLRALIDARALALPETARIVTAAAGALAAAHAVGLTHRDVKPDNIMVGSDGRVVLLDLGIAKHERDSPHTTRGVVLGTTSYLAPEQALRQAVGPATDQFALAVTAFEALTGRRPWQGEPASVIAKIVSEPMPRPSTLARLPRALDAVFERALAKRPEDRYPSVGAFAEALGRALAPGKRRTILAGATALALVVCVGLLGIAVLSWQRPAQDEPQVSLPRALPPPPVVPPPPPLQLLPAVPVPLAPEAPRRQSSIDRMLADHFSVSPLMFADVNGDAHQDMVGTIRLFDSGDSVDYLAAYDGASGARLWLSESLGPTGRRSGQHVAIQEGTIVVSALGVLAGYGLADGRPRWTGQPLPGELERYCAGPSGSIVAELGNRRSAIRLSDGIVGPAPPGACLTIASDRRSSSDGLSRFSHGLPRGVAAGAIDPPDALLTYSMPTGAAHVSAIDIATGRRRWDVALSDDSASPWAPGWLIAGRELVAVQQNDYVEVFYLRDGSPAFRLGPTDTGR